MTNPEKTTDASPGNRISGGRVWHWMMRNRFPSMRRIKQYHGPLLQCHGSSDRIVPYSMGKQLFTTAPSKEKRFLKISGGGHNDPTPKVFIEALVDFLSAIPEKSDRR